MRFGDGFGSFRSGNRVKTQENGRSRRETPVRDFQKLDEVFCELQTPVYKSKRPFVHRNARSTSFTRPFEILHPTSFLNPIVDQVRDRIRLWSLHESCSPGCYLFNGIKITQIQAL